MLFRINNSTINNGGKPDTDYRRSDTRGWRHARLNSVCSRHIVDGKASSNVVSGRTLTRETHADRGTSTENKAGVLSCLSSGE